MTTELKQSYEFGPFRLDPENRILLRDGQPVSLTPKVFDTLVLLVERSGRLVSKDELMTAIWPDSFVEESNLTQTVFMIRKALGETGSDQRYITTVPGRGYRFAADVKQVPGNGDAAAGTSSSALPSDAHSVVKKSVPRRRQVVVRVAIVLIAALGTYFEWFRSRALRPGVTYHPCAPNLDGRAGSQHLSGVRCASPQREGRQGHIPADGQGSVWGRAAVERVHGRSCGHAHRNRRPPASGRPLR